jgi:hypothetical protein
MTCLLEVQRVGISIPAPVPRASKKRGNGMSDYRHEDGERVEIILEAQRSEVPPWVRVRGLLKAALRTWGLRCLSVRDVTPHPDGKPQPGDEDATEDHLRQSI